LPALLEDHSYGAARLVKLILDEYPIAALSPVGAGSEEGDPTSTTKGTTFVALTQIGVGKSGVP